MEIVEVHLQNDFGYFAGVITKEGRYVSGHGDTVELAILQAVGLLTDFLVELEETRPPLRPGQELDFANQALQLALDRKMAVFSA